MKKVMIFSILIGGILWTACNEEGSQTAVNQEKECMKKVRADLKEIKGVIILVFEFETMQEALPACRQAFELYSVPDVSKCPTEFRIHFVAFKSVFKDCVDLINRPMNQGGVTQEDFGKLADRIRESARKLNEILEKYD